MCVSLYTHTRFAESISTSRIAPAVQCSQEYRIHQGNLITPKRLSRGLEYQERCVKTKGTWAEHGKAKGKRQTAFQFVFIPDTGLFFLYA